MNTVLRDQLLALAAAHADADGAVARLDGAQRASKEVREGLGDRAEAEGAAVTAVLERDGWPSVDLVGADGQRAFISVLVTASVDESVLVRSRDELRTEVERGRTDAWRLALVEDRLAVARGIAQPYGTIGDATVADPTVVDTLRQSVGLPTLAEQRRALARTPATSPGDHRARARRPAWVPGLLAGLGVVSLVLAVVLAAGADDGTTASSSTDSKAATSPASNDGSTTTKQAAAFVIGSDNVCDLFSQADAEALLGVALGSETKNTPSVCQYGVPGGQGSVALMVSPAEAGAAQQFAFGADGATPIDGLGQQAYFSQDLGGPLLGVLTADGDLVLLSPRGVGIPPDLQSPMTEYVRGILPRLS